MIGMAGSYWPKVLEKKNYRLVNNLEMKKKIQKIIKMQGKICEIRWLLMSMTCQRDITK